MKILYNDNRGKRWTGRATAEPDGTIQVGRVGEKADDIAEHMHIVINEDFVYEGYSYILTYGDEDDVVDARWIAWQIVPVTKFEQEVVSQFRAPHEATMYPGLFSDPPEITRIKLDYGSVAEPRRGPGVSVPGWYAVDGDDGAPWPGARIGSTYDLLSKGLRFKAIT